MAIVTGASSGLGARFAEVLAAAGAQVALVARRAERLAEVAARIDGSLVIAADVSVPADVERLSAQVIERFGRVDILVNNAGVSDVIRAEEEELDQFAGVIAVNLTAAYHLAQVVGRHMLAQRSGSIINVASVLGFRSAGQIPQAGYAASKGGLITLSKELAAQWSRRGVRVNALCPGWFQSEMTDDLFSTDEGQKWLKRKTIAGRPGHPHELDGALIWLASD
ncbi:MAG TPA: SDR family NAD(P)-dependent oxidoreductase, partial [Acidimicrobiales bacterium]|nr:SDR family NAD(P)-dependent oxidoreductase [Acidimicrobiales bacterium]